MTIPREPLYAGHAFVDWDDTIAEAIRYFHEAEEANSLLIARLTGVDLQIVRQLGQEHDVAAVKRLGLVRDSLAIGWVECYRELCGRAGLAADPESEAAIRRACQMPYEVRQDLLPGAAETLTWLHTAGFEITIWTAGDQEVQGRKIRESGLGHLVHRQAIVLDKTPERLLEHLESRDPARSFVVGNSLHSDVRPALALKIPAYHVHRETWAYDHAVLDIADPNYIRLETITDLPGRLSTRFKLAV